MTEPPKSPAVPAPPVSLDPDDWGAFRALAHRAVDDIVDHLERLREEPVWRPMPEAVRQSFDGPVPWEGEGEEAAYRAFLERVRPYGNGNLHPRFFGWVMGNGTALGALADFVASAMNPHLAGFDQAPVLVEMEAIRWVAEALGYPPGASGLFVTGGSMANVMGLAVARHARAGFDVRAEGLQGGRPRLTVYGSAETHGWVKKAAEFLGLGSASYRPVAVGDDFGVDVEALRSAVRVDRERGLRPFCVVGTAGTVNTGASDDLGALADLAAEEGLWFHVDGAFGAWAAASDRLRGQVAGMERADSLAVDLHKWGSVPFESACVLVRDAEAHRAAFASSADYLRGADRGLMAAGLPFADRGVDLTRGFKALKVWMMLRAYGVGRLVAAVEQNVDQAQRLAGLVDGHAELERLAPAPLNVVCFRYRPEDAGLDGEALDALNEEVLLRIQESGIAVPSSTRVGGRYALRASFVGHRTRLEDVDLLAESVVVLGREVVREGAFRSAVA